LSSGWKESNLALLRDLLGQRFSAEVGSAFTDPEHAGYVCFRVTTHEFCVSDEALRHHLYGADETLRAVLDSPQLQRALSIRGPMTVFLDFESGKWVLRTG
jgi:hypothetical protein